MVISDALVCLPYSMKRESTRRNVSCKPAMVDPLKGITYTYPSRDPEEK
jgi:hypothetical protein